LGYVDEVMADATSLEPLYAFGVVVVLVRLVFRLAGVWRYGEAGDTDPSQSTQTWDWTENRDVREHLDEDDVLY
jgi:hypothetical protein